MTLRLPRIVGGTVLVFVSCGIVVVALMPWRADWLAEHIQNGRIPPQGSAAVLRPWAHQPVWTSAKLLLTIGPYSPERIEDFLLTSLRARPLHAPSWLDLAELKGREQQSELAQQYLAIAKRLWPQRQSLRWSIAMLQIRLGYTEAALASLGDYLSAFPDRAAQVLGIARRLQPDAASLMKALALGAQGTLDNQELLFANVIRTATRFRDPVLAKAAWDVSPDAVRKASQIVLPYLALLTREGMGDAAQQAWTAFTGSPTPRGTLYNPDFERALVGGGLGWQILTVAGAESRRDCRIRQDGACSLLVAFDGTRNVHFHHVRQIVLISPGETYELSGWWRGDGITTRSGVFIDIRALGSQQRRAVRLAAQRGHWSWAPFRLVFSAPPDAEVAGIRIRRNKTDALDRNIAGHVWFDGLRLERVPAAEGPEG